MNFRTFGRQIFKLYEEYPLTLNSIVGGIVYVGGELTTQVNQNSKYKPVRPKPPVIGNAWMRTLDESRDSLRWYNDKMDWKRVGYIGMLGSIENGVFMLAWYRTLSRVFGDGVSTRVVLIKCLCDQIFFATQQDFLFLGLCAYNDSAQLPAALDEVRMTFLPTWLMDCSLWPLVNFIGFSAIPSTLQPTYMAFIQFFWQVYVSSLAAKDPHHHAKGEEPDLSELKGIFYKIDIDHSGFIDGPELLGYIKQRSGVNNKGIGKEQLQLIIKEVDDDGDGRISFDEFARAVVKGDSTQTNLWSLLHEDAALLSGVQSAIKRFKNFKDPNHVYSPTDEVMTTQEEQYARDLDEALQSASLGFTILAVSSVIRKLIFKI